MQWTPPRGFSLVDALIVVALLTILGAIAIPSFNSLVERGRANALADQLQAHLNFARASSVSLHRNIVVCGSSNGIDCDDGWQQGWIIRQAGQTEALRYHRLTARDHLYWNRNPSIIFRDNGSSPASNGKFTICDGNLRVVWRLVINNQGRVKREAGSASGGGHGGLCSG